MRSINQKGPLCIYFIVLLSLYLLTASLGLAQYEISWYTIDGGGGQSSGGPYTLTGTIGQPDAAYAAGGKYELLGGFWVGGPICVVDFGHFANFAEQWLEAGSGLPADLSGDGFVDWIDLERFVYQWLYHCPPGWPLR